MSINEVPMGTKPKGGGILERLAMHGMDQAQPKRRAKKRKKMVRPPAEPYEAQADSEAGDEGDHEYR